MKMRRSDKRLVSCRAIKVDRDFLESLRERQIQSSKIYLELNVCSPNSSPSFSEELQSFL